MNPELKETFINHLIIIRQSIYRLHEQSHTGIMRIDSGYAANAIKSCNEIERLIREFR